MTTQLDELIRKYATEAADIVVDGASAGYYTWMGLLASALQEAVPIIEAAVKADLAGKETPEQAAERIWKTYPDQFIVAIKEFRTWAKDNAPEVGGLADARDFIVAARDKLGALDENRKVIVDYGQTWVASESTSGVLYKVSWAKLTDGTRDHFTCSCPSFTHETVVNFECKHIRKIKEEV